MITLSHKGDFSKTFRFLKKASDFDTESILRKYGELGVEALRNATPKDTGETANSWSYELEIGNGYSTIHWLNSHVENGWANIAVLLQYGHGTRNGGYVTGIDYINPAMEPIFNDIATSAFREVTGQ